jgi:hypothetical protein
MDTATIREYATEATRDWEPRRILYNAVLSRVVIAYFVLGLAESKHTLTLNLALVVFVLAVLANLPTAPHICPTSSGGHPGSALCGCESGGFYF